MWRPILLAGNTVALTIVGVLLFVQAGLFATSGERAPAGRESGSAGETPARASDLPEPAVSSEGSGRAARPLLLIVVDALRDDTARDARAMPALAALAARGRRESVELELLLPSTIGALEAIVEGVTPPPAAALSDFGAPAARAGGWLARLVASGGRAFVAGPDLWTERYGRWIADSRVEAGMPTARSDERVASAAIRVLSGPAPPTLVVAHLAELDATAHRHGADTPEWEATVRRVDAHLGALIEAAGERAVIVVADHGTTRRGGHAGGERVVRRAPLVIAPSARGGSADLLGRAPQGEPVSARPCTLIAATLFEAGRCRDGGSRSVGMASRIPMLTGIAALLIGAFGTLAAIGTLSRHPISGFAVSAGVWVALAAAAVGQAGAGAVLATLLLGVCAASGAPWRRREPFATTADGVVGPAAVLACGVLSALAAWAWAERAADAAAPAAFPWLPIAAAVALGGGFAAAQVRSAAVAAVTLLGAAAFAMHLGGETLSLSSVDVRLAHRVAGLVSGSGGILLAVPFAIARLLLSLALALLGYRLGRRRAVNRERDGRADGRASPESEASRTLALARACAAWQLGAVTVYALMLSLPPAAGTAPALPLASAGLGGLLRELPGVCAVAGTLAAYAYREACGRAIDPRSPRPPRERSARQPTS